MIQRHQADGGLRFKAGMLRQFVQVRREFFSKTDGNLPLPALCPGVPCRCGQIEQRLAQPFAIAA